MHLFRLSTIAVLLITPTMTLGQETVSLADATNREAWRGEIAGSEAALSLDRGDLGSADTRRDLIVGAPGWNGSTGRVYVVFGGPVRGGQQSLAIANVILTGSAAGDRFGTATAAGYVTTQELTLPAPTRDLVVGAPGANGGAGAAYLFLRGFTNGQRIDAASARLIITGAPAGAQLGASLATGDLDGDGYREIIAGAPGVGAVYVIRGGPSIPTAIDLSSPSSAFFTILGSTADGFGQSLAAGDITGHHSDPLNPSVTYDLAIGAFAEGATGAVYVIRGRTSNTFPPVMNIPADADVRFGGIDAGDWAGRSLDIAPIDNDPTGDLLIGAPHAAGPANDRAEAGEIYIIWGRPTLASRSLSTADVTIYGAAAGDQEGSDIAYGDVSRAAPYDFVSVAPGAGAAGEAHLFLGRNRSAFSATIDLLTAAPDRRLIGDPAVAPIASALIYDVTGEGFEDIVAGMPQDGEGLLYVSYSIAPAITTQPASVTIENPQGGSVSLVAQASGAPTPRMQWQVSTDGGSTWTDISGATSTTLSFTAFPSDSRKRFRAVFTNSAGAVISAVAIVIVRATASDYNGDAAADLALYRPSTGTWLVRGQPDVQWGAPGDVPVPGDYDGDQVTDIAVYRPSNGTWYVRNQLTVVWGGGRDVPVPGDYDGNGTTDLAVYRPSTGTWYVRNQFAVTWGAEGDVPVPGDYDGNGATDLAVYRPSNGMWYARNQFAVTWGADGDVPVPADYDGNGTTDVAVYRPSTGTWYARNQFATAWGSSGDVPLPRPPRVRPVAGGDFSGDGATDVTVYRPSTGTWFVRNQFLVTWGSGDDIPIPGDYDGNGTTDVAVYRPSTGTWYVLNQFAVTWGSGDDVPVPGDYDRNGTTDVAVYRPGTGTWYARNQFAITFGGEAGDVPVPGDYDGDGALDLAVYRPSTGTWMIRNQFTVTWGAAGDIPAYRPQYWLRPQ